MQTEGSFQKQCLCVFIASTQNNATVREKLWNGVDCILLMSLNRVEAPACIFMCPHKLTSS